ncbi:hypothetical protein FH972_020260 [Carpinus fangiana]|uniref:Zinc finger PHD-type domain-containing protein n=1 Tax=Carpinus fangiana TaxID=176857 RepID=A0A5N6RX32_9ROSI|nr:hypothetical protein FH972_020260 [Carpinus fangiana]
MTSSDDEAEGLPQCVSNYYFEDDNDEPISFSILPIQWREGESPDRKKEQIFLHGTADNGLQKIYKHVIAWRFDLSNLSPEISVLSKENNWIKLQKPRKSFEDTIRSILITVQCLHFLKKYPETSGKSLWDHLSKVFSLYEVRPSQNDLLDHMPLISEAVKRNDTLAESKFLCTFLEEKPGKRKLSDEAVQTTSMSAFIVDEMDDDILDEEEDDSNGNEDCVCAFCDNGGDIVCCEGRCMRSFHGTVEAGAESDCVSLGFSKKEEVDELPTFICKNCEYKRHQCFACGKLGSSDKFSGAEVFQCVSATCGHFYHPCCVAKLLNQGNEVAIEELEKKIAAGESFTCPIHKCCVCKQGEKNKDPQLQFAVCRRCPKSYHRKCLPREIAFEGTEDEDIMPRAWEGLLGYNRILIYCLKHEIDEELKTPIRDHIKFPGVKTAVEKKKATMEEKKRQASASIGNKEKDLSKKKNLALDNSSWRRIDVKVARKNQKPSLLVKVGNTKSEKLLCQSDISRKVKVNDGSRKLLNDNGKSVAMEDENKPTRGAGSYNFTKGSGQVKYTKQDAYYGKVISTLAVKAATKKLGDALPSLDADTERRLLDLMKDAASSITLEEVKKKHKLPCTYAYSSRNNLDKNITMGKLEGSVEAVRAALGKLEEGGSCEDAEAVCEPEVLDQIFKWKQKLKVYLAPFLHGNRYTSFGRHFTKVEKLEEIVDKIHWYAQNEDMIVDFCCGANDFSILMKKKLEAMGKKCSYKNYDIVQAKNDFNFEKRDWMTVQPKELLPGSQLIMGLNPPFGLRASLANKFIDKALEFRPKLLILIVPPETQRLDEKKTPYDLVWEDDQSLSGKSFYLPGSVDENDKQMEQWNLRAPPLSLWSRRDFTAKHKDIAQKHGHLSQKLEESGMEKIHSEDTKSHKESSPCTSNDRGSLESKGHAKNQPNETTERKRKRDKENHERGMGEISPENEMDGERPHSPCNAVDGSFSLEGPQSKSCEIGSHAKIENNQLNETSVKKRNREEQIPSVIDGSSSMEGSQSKYHEIPSHAEIGKKQRNETFVRRNCDKKKHRKGMGKISPGNKTDGGRPCRTPPNAIQFNGPSALEGLQSKSGEMSSHIESGEKHHQHFAAAYGGSQASLYDEMGRKYRRDNSDSLSYKPYITEVEEELTRNIDRRSHVRLYGQHDPDMLRSSYPVGHDPRYGLMGSMSSPYGHPGPAVDLSYRMNTSAMQRYAPQLDELNHPRPMNTFGSEPPMMDRYSFNNHRAPQPEFQGGPMGFAPGPHHAYSHHSSAGWLNE